MKVPQKTVQEVLKAQRDLYLEKNDKILFVVDDSKRIRPIREALLGYEYQMVVIPKVERPGQDYKLDREVFAGKTVVWLITSVSISHSPLTKEMIDQGMFLISNPSITPDWPAVLNPANKKACQKNAERILKAIGGNVGGKVRITSDDGTDLLLEVPSGNWGQEIGQRKGMGTNGLYGEFFTAPYEANGVLILTPGDFLTNPINKVRKAITIEVQGNHVMRVKGGSQAENLSELLIQPRDPKALSLGEFSFGLNPGWPKTLYRSVTAEKMLGSVHIAIGTNEVCLRETCPDMDKFQYGRYNAGVHIDCIKFGATVSFQGKEDRSVVVLTNGNLAI